MKDIYVAKSKSWYPDTLEVTKYDLRLPISLLIELLKDEFGVIWEGKRTRKRPIQLLIQSLEYPQIEPKSVEQTVVTSELITAEPVVELEADLQKMPQPEATEELTTLITTDYQLQLDNLRQQEDELFKQALANPQEAQLEQFEVIWNQRNEVYMQMESAITPMLTESIQVLETQKQSTYTVEELQAIPKMNMHCPELAGKLFYSLNGRPQLVKKFKLPATVIERYKLAPKQVAILEGKLRIAPQVEEIISRYDNYFESAKGSEGYAYSARDIIIGRY